MWRGTYIAWIPMTERGRIHNVNAKKGLQKMQSLFCVGNPHKRRDGNLYNIYKRKNGITMPFCFSLMFFCFYYCKSDGYLTVEILPCKMEI